MGDTLIAPYHKSDNGQELRTFDYVVSNPPFKMDFSDTRERIAAMPVRFWAGVPKVPAKKKESMAIYTLFIQHVLNSLKSTGKGAIVVPTGFVTAMMKYLLYFFVLVSVFLTSGSSSTPENQQKYNDIYTMYSPNEDKTEYNIPQADIERYEKELYNGKQSYKMEDGYIRASLFRNISTSKNSRTNLSSSAERIVRFIKTQYPKERQTFISFCINPLKFSYGYYIYTLRRILI